MSFTFSIPSSCNFKNKIKPSLSPLYIYKQYINLYTSSLSLCLDLINVKMAKPIGHFFARYFNAVQ